MATVSIARDYERLRLEWIDREVSQWAPGAEPRAYRYRAYFRALDDITKAATGHVLANGAADTSYGEFERLVEESIQVINQLRYALETDIDDNQKNRVPKPESKFDLWGHQSHPIYTVRNKQTPRMVRPDIEAAADLYLALPFRCGATDRLFIDVLVAVELFNFADEMINPLVVPGITETPAHKERPICTWFVNAWWSLLFTLGLGVIMFGLSKIGVPESWTSWGYGIAVVLLLLSLAWATFWLPWNIIRVGKARAKMNDLLNTMIGVYAELGSQGQMSARHIREKVTRASEKGIVWPGPLFVLLDDVIARDGHF